MNYEDEGRYCFASMIQSNADLEKIPGIAVCRNMKSGTYEGDVMALVRGISLKMTSVFPSSHFTMFNVQCRFLL